MLARVMVFTFVMCNCVELSYGVVVFDHLFEVLLVPGTQKMVPNPKTRQD